jgi:hypothetical protein
LRGAKGPIEEVKEGIVEEREAGRVGVDKGRGVAGFIIDRVCQPRPLRFLQLVMVFQTTGAIAPRREEKLFCEAVCASVEKELDRASVRGRD